MKKNILQSINNNVPKRKENLFVLLIQLKSESEQNLHPSFVYLPNQPRNPLPFSRGKIKNFNYKSEFLYVMLTQLSELAFICIPKA